MKGTDSVLKGIGDEIREVLYAYAAVESISATAEERRAQQFLREYFSRLPYFQSNPELYGIREIPDDPWGRGVFWAMRRGEGRDTVVLLHHSDVVDAEDFGNLKRWAFRPEQLERELQRAPDTLPEDTRADLESGEFLFGRGCTDMKGGGAVQAALLKRYCEQENFKGNVVLAAVPDEENLSAGMRSAVPLLRELKERYGLCYRMMIDSEPHQRGASGSRVFSLGSVGKMLVSVYVRGVPAHSGAIFEGFNPLGLLSRIVAKTEANAGFSDRAGRECAPPPTWLQMSDGKNRYDVSMPPSASGLLSVLTLHSGPETVLERVRALSEEAFREHLEYMEQNRRRFPGTGGAGALPWKPKVVTVRQLYREAEAAFGGEFTGGYEAALCNLKGQMEAGEVTAARAHNSLMDFIFRYIGDPAPQVVLGLCAPYYPGVSGLDWGGEAEELGRELGRFAEKRFCESWETEYFFTGISDLSYSSLRDAASTRRVLEDYMPLFPKAYGIPLEDMEAISMPCINIGPWGKDLHRMTERVWRKDLYERTPALLHHGIQTLLGQEGMEAGTPSEE